MCELRNGTITTKQALVDLFKAAFAEITPFHADFADMTEQAFEGMDDAMRLSMKNVNKLDDNNFWLTRERLRFDYPDWAALGGYRRHPMFNYIVPRPELLFHFPHASTENPAMVAYTPSIAYGMNDRQRRCTVDSYITKFYPDLPEETRQLIRTSVCGELKVLDHTHIVRVYKEGPSSCMSDMTEAENEYGVSPLKAYELEEWGIAVIMEGTKIVARAIVRTEDKTYVRCYGDAMDLLHKQLVNAGYTRMSSWPTKAKLKLLKMDDGNIVAPYLDGGNRSVCIDGNFLCLNGSDYSLEYASGYFNPDEEEETATCDNCDDACDPDDMTFTHEERSVCTYCRDEYYSYAYVACNGRARAWVHQDNVVRCESNDEYYLDDPDVLSYHDIAQCERTGEYFKTDDLCDTVDGWIHEDYAVPIEDNSDYSFCDASDVKSDWFVYVLVHTNDKGTAITAFVRPDDADKDNEHHMSIEAASAAGFGACNDSINYVLRNLLPITFAEAA